jgi:hypothetical protein
MKDKFQSSARIITPLILIVITFQFASGQSDSLSNLSQYLLPRFDSGVVRLKTGEFSRSLMNYNTLTGRMTFYHRSEIMDLVRPETVDTVMLGQRLFVPFRDGFYELVLNAEKTFFIQHKSDLVSEGKPGALGTTSQTTGVNSVSTLVSNSKSYNLKLPENFKVKSYEIYWVRFDGEMHRFLNMHQFLKIFPAKEKELKDYIRNEKIKLEDSEDLLKLARYCNLF